MSRTPLTWTCVLFLALAGFSCSQPSDPMQDAATGVPPAPGADPQSAEPLFVDLKTPDGVTVGWVTVCNDTTSMTVEFTTTGDWVLLWTHLAAAKSLEMIPQTRKGRPLLWRFPWRGRHFPGVSTTSYTIDYHQFGWEPFDLVYVAAHAYVIPASHNRSRRFLERVWAAGEPFPHFPRASFFLYTLQDGLPDGGGEGEEEAGGGEGPGDSGGGPGGRE
ncbi:MAG: hypothetical protein GF355_16725 [Candidatus Eisenbacteria bacterium]|nr:hypothetical protein [Candidatus Eisenbacteria bacterium]